MALGPTHDKRRQATALNIPITDIRLDTLLVSVLELAPVVLVLLVLLLLPSVLVWEFEDAPE